VGISKRIRAGVESALLTGAKPVRKLLLATGRDVAPLPEIVQIESTNICNAKCVFCPRDEMHRDEGIMDMALFQKIADECAALNITHMRMHNYGEAFADRMLVDKVRYAIRDLASVADEVTKQGHRVLSLNVGDPNIFDFKTPPHLIEAVYKAMQDGKNGYAPSPGIPEALEAIRVPVESRRQELERDRLAELQVVGPVDLTHPAFSQEPDDAVAAGEDDAREEPRLQGRGPRSRELQRRHRGRGHDRPTAGPADATLHRKGTRAVRALARRRHGAELSTRCSACPHSWASQ
jgi:hypothetical protein